MNKHVSTYNQTEHGERSRTRNMKPSAALGGIEFHAKASKGLVSDIRQRLISSQSIDPFNVAAEKLNKAYREAYKAMAEIMKAQELADIEARKAELLA